MSKLQTSMLNNFKRLRRKNFFLLTVAFNCVVKDVLQKKYRNFHKKLLNLERNRNKVSNRIHFNVHQKPTMTKIYPQLPLLCDHWCLKILWDKLGESQPSLAHVPVDREVILHGNFKQLFKSFFIA